MAAKTPKALLLIAILTLVGAALLAGCGGGGSSSSSSTTESSPPAEEEATKEEGGTGGAAAEGTKEEAGAAIAEGKEVFTANCASCHTLKAANAKGTVGPNLDELMPDEATVEKQVVNGGGPMPAFGKEEILAPNEIEAVAAFVSTEAGK